jgi:hypothetical protein
VQPESTEAALEFNKMTQNLEAAVQPDELQTTISDKPTEETTANALAWPKCFMGELPKVVETSN